MLCFNAYGCLRSGLKQEIGNVQVAYKTIQLLSYAFDIQIIGLNNRAVSNSIKIDQIWPSYNALALGQIVLSQLKIKVPFRQIKLISLKALSVTTPPYLAEA